jgi:hypothetical protein
LGARSSFSFLFQEIHSFGKIAQYISDSNNVICSAKTLTSRPRQPFEDRID